MIKINLKNVIFLMLIILLISCQKEYIEPSIDGLIAYYPFNNNVIDESNNGNNGEINNVIITEDRFSNVNSAYYFGYDRYVTINKNLGNFKFDDFSISLWINGGEFSSTICNQSIFSKRNSTSYGNFFIIGTHNNKIDIEIDENDISNYDQFYSNVTLQQNEWYHICLVRESYMIKLYINGEIDKIYRSDLIHYINNSAICAIGTSNNGGLWKEAGRNFNGIIDDVYVYNIALNENEINVLYKIKK